MSDVSEIKQNKTEVVEAAFLVVHTLTLKWLLRATSHSCVRYACQHDIELNR